MSRFERKKIPLVSNYEITTYLGGENVDMTAFEKNRNALNEKLRLVRTERYACQSVARKAVPKERVSMCLRKINGSNVEVHKHRKTDKAFYSGLLVCGSVWGCPVCAAKISERRKKEIQQAFEMHKGDGGKIALLTLTFSHKKTDRLRDTIKKFGQAIQVFMRGARFDKIRADMGMIGRIRVYEVTYGRNGFHPHVHIALMYENDVDLEIIKKRMFILWEKACLKSGLTASEKYGLDLQDGDEAEKYLSKHGTWSLEQELSKSHIKKAKNDSMTPFDFLRKYLEDEDTKYLKLFSEYVECFKGKRQIQWSQGLKKRFVLVDKTDEELAKEKIEEADILGMLNYEQWKIILKNDLRSKFLDSVERYGFDLAVEITIKKESSSHEDSQE